MQKSGAIAVVVLDDERGLCESFDQRCMAGADKTNGERFAVHDHSNAWWVSALVCGYCILWYFMGLYSVVFQYIYLPVFSCAHYPLSYLSVCTGQTLKSQFCFWRPLTPTPFWQLLVYPVLMMRGTQESLHRSPNFRISSVLWSDDVDNIDYAYMDGSILHLTYLNHCLLANDRCRSCIDVQF